MEEALRPKAVGSLTLALQIAASHATSNVPIARAEETIENLRVRLIGQKFDSVSDVPVCSDGVLLGMIRLEIVLGAEGHQTVGDLMDANPPRVEPNLGQEQTAWLMVHHGERSLPVVDADGRFMGVIPPERMLHTLLQEHEEDLARFSGLSARGQGVRLVTEEKVLLRLRHRLPWLVIGLLGAMVSAWLVRSSEEQLQRTVQLAFFMPAVVYMADAVGTQTEVIAVRGLSVGVHLRRILGKELLAGFFIGVLIGLLFLPFTVVVFGDFRVAVTVSIALTLSSMVASVVALVLPWLLTAMGRDPAFGSGPLSTVIQDLLSIAIYLGLANLIVV